jgi:hypothetical protein
MKETSIYDYYAFGYNYNNWRESWAKKTNATAIGDLEDYLSNVTALELQVTSHVVSRLRGRIESLKKLKPDELIVAATAEKIQETIDGADKTLDAELQLKKVLSITQKRFDVDMLLRSPNGLLSAGCWDSMSDTAKKDFSEATRCIAMNLATAAAFHQMRCVEECVKLLYFAFVKHGRMEKPMWGPMVDKLRKKNKPRPTTELLDQLDIIRANFRNPTQHPQKFYSIDEAQDLLNSSIVAIGSICREISSRESA